MGAARHGSILLTVTCRVGMWRGWLRLALTVPGPFGCRCLNIRASPRFHIPLIEPCLRISRTRLSDKNSRVRTRETAPLPTQADQPQHFVQEPIGVAFHPPFHLVLGAQPP